MLCVAGALSLGCLATTYYVKPDGSDSAAGTSWEKAFKTPNKGFDMVHSKSANHEVVIAAGTYQTSYVLSKPKIHLFSWSVILGPRVVHNFCRHMWVSTCVPTCGVNTGPLAVS